MQELIQRFVDETIEQHPRQLEMLEELVVDKREGTITRLSMIDLDSIYDAIENDEGE